MSARRITQFDTHLEQQVLTSSAPNTAGFTAPGATADARADPAQDAKFSVHAALIDRVTDRVADVGATTRPDPVGGAPQDPAADAVPCEIPTQSPVQSLDLSRQTLARVVSSDGSLPSWRPLESRVRLATGKQIPGTRYRLVRWLGAGGMGDVFEAVHVDIERSVALKFLKPGADDDMVDSFMAEARSIAKIESRFVVDVLDSGELPDGRPFYAMELLEDNSLDALLRAGPMPIERALPILRQCCKALAAVHEAGMAHRDLKPQNILLQTDEGRPDMVRLVDFGIAAEFGARDVPVAGTPSYMAPEQILGVGFDGRLDIYALGCLACKMLSGKPPFAGETMAVFNHHLDTPPGSLIEGHPELPKQIDEVVRRCLAKAPEDRWANTLELEAALCEVQIAVGFTTAWDDLALPDIDPDRREALADRMPRPRKRGARWRRAALLAGLVLAFVAGGSFVRSGSLFDNQSSAAVDSS
jgi:hypothetical protein